MQYVFVFLVVGLMASCGDASGNASKKKEQKLKEYSTSEVVVVNDTAYFNKDMSYFTGILIEEYVYDSVYSHESEYDENWIDRSKDSSGIHSMTTWVNGVKNGIEKEWYRNGNIRYSENWKNGLADGLSQVWYENGNLMIESFWLPIKNGIYIGTHDKFDRWYYENGQLEWDYRYLKGISHGQQRGWYENGQMEFFYTKVNGKIDGKSEEWYKNGNLKSSKKYIMDKPNGIHREWHENGQLKSIENYKDGLAIGLFKSYSEMGEVIGEVNLNNGNGIFVASLHENGQKAMEKQFENGLLKYEKDWFDNGQESNENIFVNGAKVSSKSRYINGQLEYYFDYENGSGKGWYSDGELSWDFVTVNKDSSALYNKFHREYRNGKISRTWFEKFDGERIDITMDEAIANIVNTYDVSNMTAQEKLTWLSDCKRGLRDVSSKMNESQEDEYCNCVLDKMNLKYPDKNSEVDIGVSIDLGKECLIEILR